MGLVWQETIQQQLLLWQKWWTQSHKDFFFFSLNKAFFTCSVTPGNFTRVRWSCSLILLIHSGAPGSPASHSYWTGASPEQPGWRWMDMRSGSCARRSVQEAGRELGNSFNGKTEVGSGGAGSHPNKERGRDALSFSAQIPALPPFLHAGLFQSQTGCQIPSQPLTVCWFLNQIPHLGL